MKFKYYYKISSDLVFWYQTHWTKNNWNATFSKLCMQILKPKFDSHEASFDSQICTSMHVSTVWFTRETMQGAIIDSSPVVLNINTCRSYIILKFLFISVSFFVLNNIQAILRWLKTRAGARAEARSGRVEIYIYI